MSSHELKEVVDQSENIGKWEDYYKFATVRNPFKKMVSWYFMMQPDKNFNTVLDQPNWDVDSAYAHHFNDFMDHFYNDPKI